MLSSLDAFLAVEKHILHERGRFPNTIVRGPVGYTLDQETQDAIGRLFTQMMAALDRWSRRTCTGIPRKRTNVLSRWY